MRRLLASGSLVLGCALLAPTSWSGDYDLKIGIGWTVPTGILSDSGRFNLDGGLSVTGTLVGPPSGRLHWRAEVGHDDFGVSAAACARVVSPDICLLPPDLRLTRFSGGVQVAPERTAGLRPFAYLTGGVYHVVTATDGVQFAPAGSSSPVLPADRSGNFFGMGLGAGAEWLANEDWSIGGEVRLNGYFLGDSQRAFPRFDDVPALGLQPDPGSHWYVTPSLFFALRL